MIIYTMPSVMKNMGQMIWTHKAILFFYFFLN